MRLRHVLVVAGVVLFGALVPLQATQAVDARKGPSPIADIEPRPDGGHVVWQNPVGGSIDHTAVRWAKGSVPASPTSGAGIAVPGRGMQATLTGLQSGASYQVRLFTVYSDGHVVAADPQPLVPTLGPPANVVVDAGNQTLTVSWDSPPGATSAHLLVTDQGVPVSDETYPVDVAGVHLTKVVGGLVNGHRYDVSLEAQDGSGNVTEPTDLYVPGGTPRATNSAPVSPDVTQSDLGPSQLTVPDEAFGQSLGTDGNGDKLAVVGYTQPAHGYVVCQGDGCAYWPESTVQEDAFTYTVGDGHGGRSQVAVTLHARTLSGVNDVVTMPRNTSRSVRVAANDPGFELAMGDSVTLPASPSPPSAIMVVPPCCPDDDQGAMLVHTFGTLGSFRVQYLGQDHDRDEAYRAYLAVHVQGLTVSSWGLVARWVGRPLSLTVHTSYATAGDRLVIQRWTGSAWKAVSPTKTIAAGTTSYALKSTGTQPSGSWKFRVAELTPTGAVRSGMTSGVATRSFYRAALTNLVVTGSGEGVTVANTGKVSVGLRGWHLNTSHGKSYALPSRTLKAGKSLRIWTRSGSNTTTAVFMGRPNFFADTHDKIVLRDAADHGAMAVASRSY